MSSLGSSNDPGDMAEVSSRQVYYPLFPYLLWFNWLSSLSLHATFLGSRVRCPCFWNNQEDSRPSTAATHDAVDPDAISTLQELLTLSASQILECKGLDSLGACLNDLAADGRLDNATVTRASSLLERAREHFGIFARALRAEDDLKAASAVQEALRPKVDVLIAKTE